MDFNILILELKIEEFYIKYTHKLFYFHLSKMLN